MSSYTHYQIEEALVWNVQHNLNKLVVSDALVYDAATDTFIKILPQAVESTTNNTLVIRFSEPRKGLVRVK